jgi:hypothetical protein
MTIKNTWKQDVDLETTDLGDLDHGAFLGAMQAFDWAEAGAREKSLAEEGEECCPAGFGAERSDGAALHLYSTDGQSFSGSATVVRKKKILGFIPSTSSEMVHLQNMGGEATRGLIEVFFEGEASALESKLSALG